MKFAQREKILIFSKFLVAGSLKFWNIIRKMVKWKQKNYLEAPLLQKFHVFHQRTAYIWCKPYEFSVAWSRNFLLSFSHSFSVFSKWCMRKQLLCKPIFGQCSQFIPPENNRKSSVFKIFLGVIKEAHWPEMGW